MGGACSLHHEVVPEAGSCLPEKTAAVRLYEQVATPRTTLSAAVLQPSTSFARQSPKPTHSGIDAFLSKGSGPLAAQLASLPPSLVAVPTTPAVCRGDVKKDLQRPAAHSQQSRIDTPGLSPRSQEAHHVDKSTSAAHGTDRMNSPSSISHSAQRPGLPAVPRLSMESDAKVKVMPAFKPECWNKSLETSKDHVHGFAGPLRSSPALGGSSSPRVSPKLSPKLPVPDGAKHNKNNRPEGKPEGKGSVPSLKSEHDEAYRTAYESPTPMEDTSKKDAPASKGEKERTERMKLPAHAILAAGSKGKQDRVRPASSKPRTSLSSAKGGGDKDASSILVGIGERIKRRTKAGSADADRGADDGESEDDSKEAAKRQRTTRASSSEEDDEEEDDDGDDDETDTNGVPPLEAKIRSVKGAWFDIELLARDPSGECFHVRSRDHGDKEWVTAGEIRRQCQAFEKENAPALGNTVCAFTQLNRKNEVEQLYFDGHIARVCTDNKYEVSLSLIPIHTNILSLSRSLSLSHTHTYTHTHTHPHTLTSMDMLLVCVPITNLRSLSLTHTHTNTHTQHTCTHTHAHAHTRHTHTHIEISLL